MEKDDSEPALLFAEVCELNCSEEHVTETILLNEEKTKPKLGEEGSREGIFWYLDTSASNHMTGCKDVFAELDTSVCGSVRFGDGSVVEIRGRGMILFKGLAEEHKVLTDVYYIPRLCSNIISLG